MGGVIACTDPRIDLTGAVAALEHRGPDHAATLVHAEVGLGHTRLAIQDLDDRSNQPYKAGPVAISFNGEIFNADALREAVQQRIPGHQWSTDGDTEPLAWAIATLGAKETLTLIDGMFALAWSDERQPGVLHLARDRMGEIPLHVHRKTPVVAASEIKAFTALGRSGVGVVDVGAGQWWQIRENQITVSQWATLAARPDTSWTLDTASRELRSRLRRSVRRRSVADVPVCTLLSGGVDSAAITAEIASINPNVVAYTAKFDPRSRDLRCARETAHYLGIDLVEVDIPPPTAADLDATVSTLELAFKAQVEIGWACLHLARAIRADGHRVVYSGEASDELWGSYGNSFFGIRDKGWYRYRRELFAAQARKNFPRVNKAFMSASVEARLPFCDPDVVQLGLSLPEHAVRDGKNKPKAVLQHAYLGDLPTSVTTRPKVAFQDGLGLKAAIAERITDPKQFYKSALAKHYG